MKKLYLVLAGGILASMNVFAFENCTVVNGAYLPAGGAQCISGYVPCRGMCNPVPTVSLSGNSSNQTSSASAKKK